VLSLGEPDAPPPATRPPLGSLATVKSPGGERLTISEENLVSAVPITPATREEYGALLLGIANVRRPLEETALAMLREVTGKAEVGRDDAWAQRLCSVAGRLRDSTAMLAAITAPDDLLAVHVDLVTVCRAFDRALGLVCSEPNSPIAVDAANEILQDAAKKALVIFETVGRMLGSASPATQ
jgi:hypothetical protein